MAEADQAEGDLVERLQSGDEEAFVTLVQKYQVQMTNVALAFVANRSVADEVVQDTWLGVVRGIERFAGRSSLRTWLTHIVVNRARTAGRQEQKHLGPARDSLSGPLEDPSRFSADGGWVTPPVHWSEQVEDRLAAEALTTTVHQAISCLPAAQRQVIVLRDVNGLPAPDVCRLLDITDEHQRVLLHRGRVAVRRAIEVQRLGLS